MKCRVYIDEVGNANMQNTGKTHSCQIDTINARYLSLTGVVIGLDHVQNVVHPQMIAHPSKMLMMKECGILSRNFSFLETEIHKILAKKYDQYQGNTYGKKFL